MDEAERREILEEIARNEDNYPRDRISAVRALRALDEGDEPPKSLENELDRLIQTK